MRLVMMGTGPFAVPTFQSLLESDHDVLALVTRPSVTATTHGKRTIAVNPMRELAEQRGTPVLAPENINSCEAQAELRAFQADLFVVCDYGQILAPDTLAVATLGGINLHGSLLPKYRGAAPIQWAIWHGEEETGVTVIHMTPKLDAGPCLVQHSTKIGPDETAAELEPRLARLGIGAVHEAIERLARWDRVSSLGTPQDPSQASRAPRLKKSDGEVNWSRNARQIYCQFRAVQPWPGLFTYYLRSSAEPLRVILEKISPVKLPGPTAPGTPGKLVQGPDQTITAMTGEGGIQVLRVRPAGRKSLEASEFIRGYPVDPDARFGSAPANVT